MLKRERGAESNGKLSHLFIPSKTATVVPVFAVDSDDDLYVTLFRLIFAFFSGSY